MLMMHMLLVALAELSQFNINFIAVINALSIYCHGNTLKLYVGKTVTNNSRQTICKNVILLHVIYGGILNHVSLTFIDKIYPSDPLHRGEYWKQSLYAMTPYCLGSV